MTARKTSADINQIKLDVLQTNWHKWSDGALTIPGHKTHLAVVQSSNRKWNPLDGTAANQRTPRHPHCNARTSLSTNHISTPDYEPMKCVDDPDETNDMSVWSEMDSCVTQSAASADDVIVLWGE